MKFRKSVALILAIAIHTCFAIYAWRLPKVDNNIEMLMLQQRQAVIMPITTFCEYMEKVDPEHPDYYYENIQALLPGHLGALEVAKQIYYIGQSVYHPEGLLNALYDVIQSIDRMGSPSADLVTRLKAKAEALWATIPEGDRLGA